MENGEIKNFNINKMKAFIVRTSGLTQRNRMHWNELNWGKTIFFFKSIFLIALKKLTKGESSNLFYAHRICKGKLHDKNSTRIENSVARNLIYRKQYNIIFQIDW